MIRGVPGCSARCYKWLPEVPPPEGVARGYLCEAVVVGLANLAVMAGWNGDTFLWWMDLA